MNADASPDTPPRFVAMLLFQFRVVADGESNRRRLCEKRLILFESPDARSALREAKRRGRAAQHHYSNDSGGTVYFEFVGVMDLLHLGVECDPDEVWYRICRMVEPMERQTRVIPPEADLRAIAQERLAQREGSRQLRRVM
jgi:hypothetical protein